MANAMILSFYFILHQVNGHEIFFSAVTHSHYSAFKTEILFKDAVGTTVILEVVFIDK